MFYKKNTDDSWTVGKKILLPTSPPTELNENNTENDFGWIWHDEPPQEYLDSLDEQEVEQEQ